jgi:dGTPase
VTGIVNALFPLFLEHPELLPADWQGDVAKAQSREEMARVVLDYVAGMTDRFAIGEYQRLLG